MLLECISNFINISAMDTQMDLNYFPLLTNFALQALSDVLKSHVGQEQ